MNLRELMIADIKNYDWLDYDWEHRNSEMEIKFKTYENYLNSLNDKDFIFKYNCLIRKIDNLD